MWNLKIESPDDTNYSDDELTFLPFYTMFRHAAPGSPVYEAARIAIERTWKFVRPFRSALWNSIYIASGGQNFNDDDVESIGWNLRTWPLDLIDWPVQNSQRRDITFDINTNRDGQFFTESVRGARLGSAESGIVTGA